MLVPEEAVAILKNARLGATVQKMPCLHSLVRPELAQEIEQVGVIVRTAMSRGQGTVEMFTAETTPGSVGRSRKASSGWSTWPAPARHGGRSANRRLAPTATTSALTGHVPCWATSVPSDLQPPRMLR